MAVTVKANPVAITDYTYHASISITDFTADAATVMITDPVDNNGFHSGQPQKFSIVSDGVLLTVTNLDKNQVIAINVGVDVPANVPGRVSNFYAALGDILKALKQLHALIASPRSPY